MRTGALLVVLFSVCVSADWTIDLEYSVDDFVNEYPLGAIEMRRTFDGNYTAVFRPKADKQYAQRLSEHLSSVYRVRTKASNNNAELITYTKPCLLLQAKLFHLFWVSVDTELKTVHSVTVFPDVVAAGGHLDSEKCDEKTVDGDPRGSVHVHNKGVLPTPDTQAFVQKMENERRSRQHGAETDNRSFLAKYWMYIVPVVIFMVLSNVVNPDGQGQAAE